MPKHKLAGITARQEKLIGEFTSIPMRVNSGRLYLNADLNDNSSIEAELLTPQKEPIPEYGFENFKIRMDCGKTELTWNGQPVRLMMREFMLHIRFSNAVLYSIQGDIDTHPLHPVYQY